MKKWIRTKLHNLLYNLYHNTPTKVSYSTNIVEATGAGAVEVNGLAFNVMSAQGGTVVQLRSYDRQTDRNNTSTHVIPDGEDIATAIGHIVSMELLRS